MKPTRLYTLALILAALIAPAALLDAAAPPTTRPTTAPATRPVVALPESNDTFWAVAVSVHDGDTLTARLRFPMGLEVTRPLRLKDVFAPELKEKGGLQARDEMATVIKPGDIIVVRLERLRGHVYDVDYATTFERLVAQVSYRDNFGEWGDLNEYMRGAIGKPAGIGAKP